MESQWSEVAVGVSGVNLRAFAELKQRKWNDGYMLIHTAKHLPSREVNSYVDD